jgi:hypothetical protein
MTSFRRYVEQYGLPRSLYVDRAGIYETARTATADEELAESGPLTQFGRAMSELEVELICAHSPQAKGRVERRHAVFQDRLVKALRLSGIDDLDSANRFLEEKFLPEMNERFTVTATRTANMHRRLPRTLKLDDALCLQESRVVHNDWTVQWRGRRFQLAAANQSLALVRQSVLVCEHLDGTIRLMRSGRELAWHEIFERRTNQRSAAAGPTGVGRAGIRPAADHPWRTKVLPPRVAPPACPPCCASVASVATLPALPPLRKADRPAGKKKKRKKKSRPLTVAGHF